MFSRKDAVISFSGLKEGKHRYSFELGQAFFESFDYGLIQNGLVTVQMQLEKMNTMMVLHFEVKGQVVAECDLCLENLDTPLDSQFKLIVKFGDEAYEETDEIVVLPHSAHEIDLNGHLYEFAMLSLPSRNVHQEGECNPDMVSRLSGEAKEQNEPEADPRWAALKRLKN